MAGDPIESVSHRSEGPEPNEPSHQSISSSSETTPSTSLPVPSVPSPAPFATSHTSTSAPLPPFQTGRETSTSIPFAGTGNALQTPAEGGGGGTNETNDEENSLTAALVAALVQTRDGPPPPPPDSASTYWDLQSLELEADLNAFTQDGGLTDVDGLESEGAVDEAVAIAMMGGTTTRSGRRTRPTSAALAFSQDNNRNRGMNPSPSASMMDCKQKIPRIRWSTEEDAILVKLIKEEPPLTWTQMGERMGRPGAGCAMRWYNFIRQQVGGAEAEELSKKMRGPTGSSKVRGTEEDQEQEYDPEDAVLPEEDKLAQASKLVPIERAILQPHSVTTIRPMQPSSQMQVGSSREARSESAASFDLEAAENSNNILDYDIMRGYPTTGEILDFATIPHDQVSPQLPPAPSNPGHPLLRTRLEHSTSQVNSLPDPPPRVRKNPTLHVKNTVIRGRRTHNPDSLEAVVGPTPPNSKAKKVHPCPATGCNAAFKRAEHLKRHYKSVHKGEKPFPCKVEQCGKSFSRKDNLQQHQALVHQVRAIYTYPDGTVSVNAPDNDDEPVIITYEEVDITKTARGAARHARQEARAKRNIAKKAADGGHRVKRSRSSSTKSEFDDEQFGEEEEEGKEEEEEEFNGNDDFDLDFAPHTVSASSVPDALMPFALPQPPRTTRSRNSFPRTPSTVQGLMSSSSAATQSFSIGPNPNNNLAGSNGRSVESNGGGSNVVGEKRTRENSEGGGGSESTTNGVDKRLRLTGDVQAHELDPALRVLADAISTSASSISSSSIAPNSTGLSPLVQHALEQRLVQSQPRDLPVNSANPFALPNSNLHLTPRPFATSSSIPSPSNSTD
ncbi:uncharacterized protein JCM6883_005607 [Sporobolomyces salmoneus]|uniref:uncharacterized protein n=1 Tax=Sporobolomyces salmoneus TaxID=183962 RepID=UPI003178E976